MTIKRQVVGSRNIALATAQLCHTVVRSAKFTTIDELLALVKAVGRKLVEANPKGEVLPLMFDQSRAETTQS